MLAMGLTPGTQFTVIRIAPLGVPIVIRVCGTDLCLQQNEVAAIQIEHLEQQPATQKIDSLKEELIVAVIGNPNCGKTALFNGLTSASIVVSFLVIFGFRYWGLHNQRNKI